MDPMGKRTSVSKWCFVCIEVLLPAGHIHHWFREGLRSLPSVDVWQNRDPANEWSQMKWDPQIKQYMDVSENSGTPKSSILIGFSIINYKPSILGYHYFWKHHETPIYIYICIWYKSRSSSTTLPHTQQTTALEDGSYGLSTSETSSKIAIKLQQMT